MRLEGRNISVRFGGIRALDDVTIAVDEGQIASVIGPNGSGKSTFFNALTGFAPLYKGSVTLDGKDISKLSVHRRVQQGMCRTFQTPRIDPEATVLQAVEAGGVVALGQHLWEAGLGTPRCRREARENAARAREILDQLDLAHLAGLKMGELPMGSVRLIDVGRAMMGQPKFLLLDEPAAGLSHAEQEVLKDRIRAVAADGVGVILVEHNFRFVSTISDTITVLENGRMLDAGTPEEVSRGPEFIRIYLGSAAAEKSARPAAVRPPEPAKPLVACRGLTARYGRIQVCFDIDLDVPAANVVAVLGANGAGKSSLVGAIGGLVKSEGSVTLRDREMHGLPAHRRAAEGICFVPELRGNIFPSLSVEENLYLARRRLAKAEATKLVDELKEMFPRLQERMESPARMLSGGEQQMLALALALSQQPKVLLLDEPTQGLAPAVYDVLEDTIRRVVDRGIGVVLTEQNSAFAARVADSVVVLSDGRVSLIAEPEILSDRERLMRAYIGADIPRLAEVANG